jgi:hypothetical protein
MIGDVGSLKKVAKEFSILPPNFGIDAITDAGPFDRPLDDPGDLKFLEVLGGGWLCEAEYVHQVSAHAGIPFDKVLQDGYPCRVGNGLCHIGHVILLFGKQAGFSRSHIAILRLIKRKRKIDRGQERG